MAWEGQRRTAARTAAERSAGGVASSTITVPSSSLWVKISGASAAHRPAPQHLLRSVLTRKALTSPLQRQPVQPVHEHVGPELELVKRFGEAKAGKPGEQRGQRDAQLKPGEVLARALVYPVPERDMRLRLPAGQEPPGSAHSPGSRFAAASEQTTHSPTLIRCPLSTRSSAARRTIPYWITAWNLSSSSTARSIAAVPLLAMAS
jgi:hypothetical protein